VEWKGKMVARKRRAVWPGRGWCTELSAIGLACGLVVVVAPGYEARYSYDTIT
jgi:hypothetical protein